jgi:hypothetical protein
MKPTDKERIKKLLTEIALTVAPVIIKEGRQWLEGLLRSGKSASTNRKRKTRAI